MSLLLKLSIEGNGIHEGAPVRATVLLDNDSELPEIINRRLLLSDRPMPHELSFEIDGPHGRAPFQPSIRVPALSEEFEKLKGGWLIGRIFDLARFFRLPRGDYQIRALYSNFQDPPPESEFETAWKGEIASDPVRIQIL